MNKKILLSILITAILVTLLLTQIKITDILIAMYSIPPHYLFLSFIFYICSYILRALRFHILLNGEVSLRDLFNIVCVHNMANNILPARTGELSYIYLLRKRNIPVSKGAATLLIVRIFDSITISLLFFISMPFVGLPPMVLNAFLVVTLFLIAIILFLVYLIYKGERFAGFIRGTISRLSIDKFHIIMLFMEKLKEILECIKIIKLQILLQLFLVSILIWCLLYLTNYTLLMGMVVDITFPLVVFGSTFSVFTTLMPIQGIGGFGTTEGGWVIGFVFAGLTKEIAIRSGFVVHMIALVYFVTLGLLSLLGTRKQKITFL